MRLQTNKKARIVYLKKDETEEMFVGLPEYTLGLRII